MDKKAKALFLMIFMGCFLALFSSSVSAAECGKKQDKSFFDFLPKDFLATAENAIKSLGYNVALAIAPDPDFCGGETYVSATNPSGNACTGGAVSPVTIGWNSAGIYCTSYYILTVPGFGSYQLDCSTLFHTISGLAINTTYTWSVEAYYTNIFGGPYGSAAGSGIINQPSGSFTTSNCVPTLTVDLIANPASGNAPLGVNIGGTVIGGTATGNVNYYFWKNCVNATANVSQAKAACFSFGIIAPNGSCSGNNDYFECTNVATGALSGWMWQWYNSSGNYTAKMIVERGGLAAQDQQIITVADSQKQLTVTKSGTGSGTVTSTSNPTQASQINCGSTCSASYASGTPVTLTANPSSGSQFDGWSEDADCNDGSVTMDANKACTATFNLACVYDDSCRSDTCEGRQCDPGCGFPLVDGTRDCGWKEVAP